MVVPYGRHVTTPFTRPATARVVLERPQVRRDRVRFRWTVDRPNPLQVENGWTMRYDGLDLAALDRTVLYEVLLSLQLPVWGLLADRVEVVLPEPVPAVVPRWWRAYHGTHHVEVLGPLLDVDTYDPLRRALGRRGPSVAVSFGGGKDSTLALHALADSRAADDLLLLHLVHPFSRRPAVHRKAVRRSRRTVVRPALRAMGARSQLVRTDFLGGLTARGRAARPHVALYVAATLPALLLHGVRAVTVSRTALGYRVSEGPDGVTRWANGSGRPERLEALARYYQRVLGVQLQPESTHYALGELVSFGALKRLYPSGLDSAVMCMRTVDAGRWCLDCAKCMEHFLFDAALGSPDARMDVDRLLGRSAYVGRLVRAAQDSDGRRAWHGNAPFDTRIGTASHFTSFCHSLHRIDPVTLRARLGSDARHHLDVLREAWGQVELPAAEVIEAEAVAASGPLGTEVAGVASRAFPVVPERPGLLLAGDDEARFRHGERMPVAGLEDILRMLGPGRSTREVRPA